MINEQEKAVIGKNTPGPWHTGGHGNTIIYAADGWAVADVKVYHDRHNGYDEMQANARLIAAAPKMRDALYAILFQVVQGKVLERDACITQARIAYLEAMEELECPKT